MNLDATETLAPLSQQDEAELTRLLHTLELSEGAATIFAIAPEPSPEHPVVRQFQRRLGTIAETFPVEVFHYSDRAFYEFLYSSEKDELAPTASARRLVMIYGLDQLPKDRLMREMDQLNRGREAIAKRNLVLVFWLNKASFLDEFRSHAPDFWDWRGKVVTFQTRPSVHPLLYPYLEWLIAENSYLKMSGIMQVNRQVDLFLDQVYVSLKAERRQQFKETSVRHQRDLSHSQSRSKFGSSDSITDELNDLTYESFESETGEIAPRLTDIVIEKAELSVAVRKYPFCVILGAPGAGKTTLLRYLALHFAKTKRDRQDTVIGGAAQENLGESLLPIFFRIADYAEQLEQQPKLSLLDYLCQFYRHWETYFPQKVDAAITEFPHLLLTQMQQGNCLILLDGLDEVFDQQSRRQIVDQIEVFVNEFSRNKFIITSRIAGYQEVKLGNRFTTFTITDMDEEQVSCFLNRWCQAIEKAQQPEVSDDQWQRTGINEAKSILKAIQSNEGVKRLTTNPLLLTILALIHRNGTRLPHRRVDLYALAVKTFIEDWQLAKKLPQSSKVLLKENEVIPLLAPLAYWMHKEKPSGLVTQEEAEQQLAIKLGELHNADPQSDLVRQTVAQFLRRVRETTGLLVERAPGVYGFMHLTFEEYFVARFIADHQSKDVLKIIQQNLQDPRWNEPSLLALGFINSSSYEQSQKLIARIFHDLIYLSRVLSIKKSSRILDRVNRSIIKRQDELARIKIRRPRRILWFLNGLAQKIMLIFDVIIFSLWNLDTAVLFIRIALFNYSTLLKKSDLAFQVLSEIDLSNYLRLNLIRNLVIFESFSACFDDLSSSEINFVKKIVGCVKWLTVKIEKTKLLNLALPILSKIKNSLQDVIKTDVPLVARVNKFESLDSNFYVLKFLGEIVNNLGIHYAIRDGAQRLFLYMSFCRVNSISVESSSNIEIIEKLHQNLPDEIKAYAYYQLGRIYQDQEKYDLAIFYHRQSLDLFQQLNREKNVANQWGWLADCYRDWHQHSQALECGQNCLKLRQKLRKKRWIAYAHYRLGCIYQNWEKYREAIAHYTQSRDLYQELEKEPNVANLWYRMADCYRAWGKYELALAAAQQDLAIRQRLNDQPNIALASYQRGQIYQEWGKYDQAIAHYTQSRDLYQELEKEKDVANLWYRMADCYRAWGKYEQALAAAQQDLAIRQRLNDQTRIALASYQRGQIYQEWGKYDQAIAHYTQSRDLYQELEKEKDVANLWYRMADCYRAWGKYEQALAAAQQDLAIRQRLNDQTRIALASYQRGQIYQEWGKYDQAIVHYSQSRDLYQELEKEPNVANLWYRMADCYRAWGKYELALAAAQQDLAIRQRLNDQPNIADASYQQGQIYQEWGKYDQAIVHYTQSRDLYQELEKEPNVANQWYNLADCYRAWGKYELALAAAQQDLAIRQQLNDQTRIALASYQRGQIYQEWGKYDQAIAHYSQSRDLYQELEKEPNVANQWYWMADCYRAWGKYELALAAAQQDLAIRQQLNDQTRIALASYQRGQIYQEWGKYDQAIAHYSQSRDLYQELEKEPNVANQWYWMADCYRAWGKYELALAAAQQDLAIRQRLDDQTRIALASYQQGQIYQEWGKYDQAIVHHTQSRDLYQQLEKEPNVANQWYNLADCYRAWGKYELALAAAQQDLAIRQQLNDQPNIALASYQRGQIYQEWGKYDQAIAHYTQSRDLYQELEKEKDVANQWYRMADCYRAWGKYELALAAAQQNLAIRQQLNDQTRIALASYQRGQIYQEWGKYDQAIVHYTQSRDLYQELEKEPNVANQWYNLADCYRAWGKYELALAAAQQDLAIRQRLNDQPNIADASYQRGQIYQEWGKYDQAIAHYTQSRDLYQELEKEKDVADLWYQMADCYRAWGKYELALAAAQQDLAIRQRLDDQTRIALASYQRGQIYQEWGKYDQAIVHYSQSRDLYETLDMQQAIANQLSHLADCYRDLKDCPTAIEYYQHSLEQHRAIDHVESVASRLRQLSETMCRQAQMSDREPALALLQQADQHVQQAMQLNTAGDYHGNLAYDQIILTLLAAEHLRWLPAGDTAIPGWIAQFEQSSATGFSYFTDLGKTVNRAVETLEIARVYLDISALENLDRAETLTRQSLQTFQDFNRRKRQAEAYKLLGEIDLKRSHHGSSAAAITARQFLSDSVQLYRDLTLTQQAEEVERLLSLINN